MAKNSSVRCTLIVCLCCNSFGFDIARIDRIPKQEDSKSSQPNSSTNQPGEVTFKMKEKGESLTSDGNLTYYTKYISSTGKVLYESWIYFNSVAQATKKVSDLHEHSAKDLRDSTEIDKNGQPVGRRILVLSRDEHHGSESILAWNNGTKYREVRSNSLEDVLAFEKRYRPPAKQSEH